MTALPPLAALLSAVGVLLALRAPGYPTPVAAAFAVAALARLLLGRDGRRLLPRRLLGALFATLAALALPFLFAVGDAGGPLLPALLGVLTALATVALLARLDAFGAFWLVLLSSTHAAGSCYVERDVAGLLLVPAYVAALAATLVVLERAVSAERRRGAAGRTLTLRSAGAGAGFGAALAAGTGRLLAGGFVLGGLLWVLAPRPGGGGPGEASPGPDPGTPGAEAQADGSARGASVGRTGPDEGTEGAVLGAVGRIQLDRTVHAEYRLLEGEPPQRVVLRQDALDLWSDDADPQRTGWRSSGAGARPLSVRPSADGWLHLSGTTPGARRATLTLRRRHEVLFLEPEVARVRVRRPGRVPEDDFAPTGPLADLPLRLERRRSEELRPSARLETGDVVEAWSLPPPSADADLLGRMSGPDLAPLRSTVEIEPGLGERLRELARAVPGVRAADPWRRALALTAWLKGPEFVYALESPALAPGRRVADFLARVRRGNCEWFATALTLLLRAHALPARYVRGYWGGSHTPGSRLWTFSGADYHAWTELYLEGAGWVPLNPTPPERSPYRTETVTEPTAAAPSAPRDGEGTTVAPETLRRWVGEALARGLDAALLRPLHWAFVGAGRGVGWGLVAAASLLLLLPRRLRAARRAAKERLGRPGTQAYAQALGLLARHGHRRRASETARDLLAGLRGRLPGAAHAALATLTAAHEAERYGGRGRIAAEEALEDLRRALEGAPPSGA